MLNKTPPGPYMVRHHGPGEGSWEFSYLWQAQGFMDRLKTTYPAGHLFVCYDSDGRPLYEVRT